jgi:hypothetical protein
MIMIRTRTRTSDALETNDKKHLDPAAPAPAPYGHSNTFLESKLSDATAERERLYSENAELKLIIEGLQKQIASPATAPADDDDPITTRVPRETFKRVLKASGNNLRKVTLP